MKVGDAKQGDVVAQISTGVVLGEVTAADRHRLEVATGDGRTLIMHPYEVRLLTSQ